MRNRKRFRRPLRRESFSRPLPGVCASRASPQHCTMPRSHGGVRSGSSQVLPLHRIEIETREGASGKAESKGGWHCREDGRTDGGREACPMSVANNKIITVQKMGDATVKVRAGPGQARGRPERGERQGGWATTVAANIQIPSPSILVFFGPAPAPVGPVPYRLRPPPPPRAQFHFILLGCNRRRFSRSESMAPR